MRKKLGRAGAYARHAPVRRPLVTGLVLRIGVAVRILRLELEGRRGLELILGAAEGQTVGGGLEVVHRPRDILAAQAEEAADIDDDGRNLAAPGQDEIL